MILPPSAPVCDRADQEAPRSRPAARGVRQLRVTTTTQTVVREESWGSLVYDKQLDEFSASVLPDKSPLPESPIALGWVIKAECDKACSICHGNVEELPRKAASTSEALRIADNIAQARIPRVVISGGEPLLRKDLILIVDRLVESGTSVVLGTNGSLLTASKISSLRELTRLETSLDSADRSLNDRLRRSRNGVSSSYDDALRAIRLCLDSGIRLRVLTALDRRNQAGLFELASLLYELGVRDWAISPTLPAGRARAIYEWVRLTDSDSLAARNQFDYIKSYYPDMIIRTSLRSPGFNRFYCLVLPDGNVATEDMALGRKVVFGSVIDRPFSAWWTSSNFDLSLHFRKWVGDRVSYERS